jgi:membrane protease YdiL (CAAX protease family)
MAAQWGRAWALLGSSLLFGAIHLVPSGLPTLSALGLVLGIAFLRTADIRVCILVHGAWNGAVFLFTRWALG